MATDWRASAKYHAVLIKDGGGLSSTLDWQVPPAAGLRDSLGCVRKALFSSMPVDACARIRSRLQGGPLVDPVFSEAEVMEMRSAVCDALGVNADSALTSFEFSPYKYNLISAMASAMDDVDQDLPSILQVGAPTGVRKPIAASGVWPLRGAQAEDSDHGDHAVELFVCDGNHLSAEEQHERVQRLIDQEIAKGYMEKIEGGKDAVEKRFSAESLAVGKLGVISRADKDDRLIGDSRASGASPAAQFQERSEVPCLSGFGEALDRHARWCGHAAPCPDEWILLSLDVKGAHKSIRTDPKDIGFAVFHLLQQYYVYLVNHFGASWSAYWWSRLSALLLRIFHLVLRYKHLGVVYVDDFLFLLPRAAHLPMVALLIALAQILGVPLSWTKMQLGLSVTYLGWQLSLKKGDFFASLSEYKKQRLLCAINWFVLHPRRVLRKELEELIGLLVWTTQLKRSMRGFLAPLFHVLYRPVSKMQLLRLDQLRELVDLVDPRTLLVSRAANISDVQKGWKLRDVASRVVSSAAEGLQPLRQPKLTGGTAWVRFCEWGKLTNLDSAATAALRLLKTRVRENSFHWAGARVDMNGAADAWANASLSGLGGWCLNSAGESFWFHLGLRLEDMPSAWQWPRTMQQGIATLELLAQLALVLVRKRVDDAPFRHRVVLRQCSDNMPVVGSIAKGLSTKPPLCYALKTLAYAGLRLNCDVEVGHLAGERNETADVISRKNQPGKEWKMPTEMAQATHVPIAWDEILQLWDGFLSGPKSSG